MTPERKIAKECTARLQAANTIVRKTQTALICLIDVGIDKDIVGAVRAHLKSAVAAAAPIRSASIKASKRAQAVDHPRTKIPRSEWKRQAITTIECVKGRCEIEDNGCWIWAGGINADGFAVGRIGSVNSVSIRRFVANEHFGKEAMEGRRASMTCGNRTCLNPAHMRKSTPAQVLKEAHRAGRMFGPTHRANAAKSIRSRETTKLTQAQATEIRRLKGERPRIDVANEFGISISSVSKIWANKLWRESLPEASPFSLSL